MATLNALQTQNKPLSEMNRSEQVGTLLAKATPVIKAALPKHLSADRMLQVALTCTKIPALKDCHVPSLIGGIVQLAAMGLEPNTVLGHGYLIPFNNNAMNRKDVQVIIGYKGLIDLARRSGQIVSIAAHAVYPQDHFEYQYGLIEKLEHIPGDGVRNPKDITHFYAVAHMVGGGHAFEVMTIAQVNAIAKDTPVWRQHKEEMGRKTAIRRLSKYLPLSLSFARAVAIDEAADDNRDQGLDDAIEGAFDTVMPDSPVSEVLDENTPITDANGEVWSAELHAKSAEGQPIYKNDGTFKAKRGAKAAQVEVAPAVVVQPNAEAGDPGAGDAQAGGEVDPFNVE